MSGAESTSDRRFRIVCEGCDWCGDATYPNPLVARAEAERHDERQHDGDEQADVEAVTVATDGGTVEEIAPEDDRIDPRDLGDYRTPAYVHTRDREPVFVADYSVLDSGWTRVTEWTGDRWKLPPHRVRAIHEVRTERYGKPNANGFKSIRVADQEKRQAALAKYPDTVDGVPLADDGVDRGEGVHTDGGLLDVVTDEMPVVSGEISDPDGATAYQALAIRVRPEDHPRLQRAGFHSPDTLYVLFSPGGRPLADYDPYKLANDAPGRDNGWIVDQLRALSTEAWTNA